MIKVSIVDEPRVLRSIDDALPPDARVAWAQEGAESRGYCAFRPNGELLYVVDRDSIFELLVRAALNALDLSGAEEGFATNPTLFDGLYLLGFQKDGDRLWVNLKQFFQPGSCGGHR